MRVGFDAKRLFNNFTGLGNYSRFVVNALSVHVPENEYWLYTPRVKRNADTTTFLDSNRYTIRTPQTAFQTTFPSWWRSVSLGNVAKKDHVTIFHGLSNELPAVKPAHLKTVLTVHDLIFKRFPQYYHPIDVRIYDWKLRRSLKLADTIVAVSQQTADDLHEWMGVERERIRVVYQGCHPNFERIASEAMREQVRKKYKLPERFILYVGTIERRKNALTLLKALAHLKERIPVVLVGRATEYMKELNACVASQKLEGQVQFLHQVAFEDLPAIYQSAQLFVYPSVFEGFGIPIVEAIVSRVPVITSRGSCFDEAGGPATIYADPQDSAELAQQINRVWSDEALRSEMINQSLSYVQRFRPSVIAADLMDVYKRLR